MATVKIALGLGLLALTACARPEPPPAPAPPPAPEVLTPEQELERFCRVCRVDSGSEHQEYLPSRLDLTIDGRTYRFCKDDCRAKFDASRESYLLKP